MQEARHSSGLQDFVTSCQLAESPTLRDLKLSLGLYQRLIWALTGQPSHILEPIEGQVRTPLTWQPACCCYSQTVESHGPSEQQAHYFRLLLKYYSGDGIAGALSVSAQADPDTLWHTL